VFNPSTSFRVQRADRGALTIHVRPIFRVWRAACGLLARLPLVTLVEVDARFWGMVLTIVLGAGCGRSGESGVHVVVTVDSSMASGVYFDHVTVTAQGGGETATACFFPPDAPARQAAVTEAGSDDPCVDLLTMGTPNPPTAATWDLSGAPRSVNFVFPEGVTPSIVAYAALGESGPVAAANLTAPSASPDFPDVTIALSPVTTTQDSCALDFAPAGVESSSLVCDAPPVAGCLDMASSGGCASTVQCLSGTARIVPTEQPCGSGSAVNMVWRADATQPEADDCAPVVLVGRFVRCASGSPADAGCLLTTDCTPPPTLLGYENTALPQQVTDISCLPPSLVPRALVVFFSNQRSSSDTRAYPFLIESPPSTDPGDACFLDVQSIFVASSSQIACPSLDAGLAVDAGIAAEGKDAGPPDASSQGGHDGGGRNGGK